MKTIVILLDSMNRRMLKTYNENTWVKTPNINKFSAESITMENHFVGSMPCMPARRDIFTGRLNFLERGWCGLEPYDVTLQQVLKEHKITNHMITDHTHYVEMGGENYLQQFDTWDIHRGQEYDKWVSLIDAPTLPKDYYGKVSRQYECNRTRFISDRDFPTPRTFQAGCEWAKENARSDNFFLMVEGFDPHEPFDTPDEFLAMYESAYEGNEFEWSTYDMVTEPKEAVEHLRKKYAATLSMADKWFGKFIGTLKDNNLFEDSLIILTTDHGHILGEHDFTGKNIMHTYNEIAHIPLIAHLPKNEYAGERRKQLTQNIDLMPTLLSYFGIDIPETVKGHSLLNVFKNKEQNLRKAVIYGSHGSTVNVTDGCHTYFRAPVREDNQPCFNYAITPTSLWSYLGIGDESNIECGRFLPRTKYPQFKIPNREKRGEYISKNLLFNIVEDYEQRYPLEQPHIESNMIEKMINCMKETESPTEQFERLGL